MGRFRPRSRRAPASSRPSPLRQAWRRIRRKPVLAGPSGFDDPGLHGPPDAGVREPRHPRPTVGAGAMALPIPDGD